MFVILRVLLTVVSALIGVVAGGLLGFFGPFYFCVVVDWLRDAGPGNSIGGGMWVLCFFTVPWGAFAFGTRAARRTWNKLQPREAHPAVPDMALKILGAKLSAYERLPYSKLLATVGTEDNEEVVSPSGVRYQIDTTYVWDGEPSGGNIRVTCSVYDSEDSLIPRTDSFIMGQQGERVGE